MVKKSRMRPVLLTISQEELIPYFLEKVGGDIDDLNKHKLKETLLYVLRYFYDYRISFDDLVYISSQLYQSTFDQPDKFGPSTVDLLEAISDLDYQLRNVSSEDSIALFSALIDSKKFMEDNSKNDK